MKNEKFDEVINFAIEREREAAQFYHDMQNLSKTNSAKEAFRELEYMEVGHIAMLKNLTKDDVKKFVPPNILNLKISDYMEQPVANDNPSYQDAIKLAIKREENALNLYNALADDSTDENAKSLFLRIATEEAKHKLMLESLYDEEFLKEN